MESTNVKEWLANNPDKWENDLEFKFLVPIDEVPKEVVDYIRERELADKELEGEIDEYVRLGLNDQ